MVHENSLSEVLVLWHSKFILILLKQRRDFLWVGNGMDVLVMRELHFGLVNIEGTIHLLHL